MTSRHDECRAKHQAVVQFMQDHNLEAVVLSRRCNFAWYTAGGLNHVPTSSDVGLASLVILPDRAIGITNAIEAPRQTDEELEEVGIDVRAAAWHDASAMAGIWTDIIGSRRAAADTRVPGLPASVSDLDASFARLRWVMSDGEIERYRVLARDVAEVLESMTRSVRPGMTEYAVAGRLCGGLFERGIRSPVILVASDHRIRRYRHPLPTGRRVDDCAMVVAGGERHGLCVSATRLISFGPIDEDLARRHAAVCRVDAAMIAATRPGKTLGDVFRVAQQAYAEAGFPDEWQHHHQGGSTGYLGREVKAGPDDETPILENQVFAWNPSIAGTKSEDTILVGPERNDILSATSEWPTTKYEANGHRWPRCDILQP